MKESSQSHIAETPEAHATPTNVTGTQPLLLTAKMAAAMCGKSVRTWRSWDAAGRIPRPIRIGRSTLWDCRELENWVAAGCPSREEWEARQ